MTSYFRRSLLGFFCLSKLYVQIPKISKITCIIALNLSNGYGWAWPQSTWLAGPLRKISYNRYISYNNIATLNKAFDDGSGSGLSWTLDLPGKHSQLSKRDVEPGPLRALDHSVTLRPNGAQLGWTWIVGRQLDFSICFSIGQMRWEGKHVLTK